jgi:hypothetical protein
MGPHSSLFTIYLFIYLLINLFICTILGIGLNSFTSGSGIYSSGYPMETFFNPTWSPAQQLLVATLPKNPIPTSETYIHSQNGKETNSYLIDEDTSTPVVTTFVASPGASGSISVSSFNLTCDASYQIS